MKRIFKWIGVLVAIGTAGQLIKDYNVQHPTPPDPEHDLAVWNYAQRHNVMNYFRSNLKDFESAQFKPLFVVDPGPHWTKDMVGDVCGYYNARNSFGAYVGWHAFVSVGDTKHNRFTVYTSGTGGFDRAWAKHCLGAKFMPAFPVEFGKA